MDALQGFGEIGIGSRLKRVSEYIMRENTSSLQYISDRFRPIPIPYF